MPLPGVGAGLTGVDPSRLESIARNCEAAAGQTDSIRQRTVALFHAGSANLELGRRYKDGNSGLPAGLGLATAADQLDLVVRSTNYVVIQPKPGQGDRDRRADRDKRAAPGAELPGLARLELARTYKLQGRYPDAISTLEKMLQAAPNQPNAAAKLELARVYLERSKDGAVSDGSLEKAVGYLEVFALDLQGEDPELLRDGRVELIARANQLGLAMMNAPPSRETSQRAMDAFAKAEAGATAAGPTVTDAAFADIYVKQGQAKLRMSGLPALSAPTVFDCEAKGDLSWLGEADRSFTAAVGKAPDSAEANDGKGCALQAIASQSGYPPTDAIPWFEKAVSEAKGEKRYWLSYARALGASGRDATNAFQQALSLAGDDKAESARIRVEIAKIFLEQNHLDLAKRSAQEALADDRTNGAAHLVLAKALYQERAGSPGSASKAKSELDQAVSLTHLRAEQKSTSAEALYYRSLLEMEPPNRSPRAAVRDAIDAANSDDEQSAYKEHACLATVRFLDSSLVADGKIRCSPEESPDLMVSAKGALMEGMFYLATTKVHGIDKDKGHEWAIKSFERGLARLGDGSPGEDTPTKVLRAKLTVGRAIAYSCVGLKDTGLDIMKHVDATYQGEADQYFVTYDVRNCQR